MSLIDLITTKRRSVCGILGRAKWRLRFECRGELVEREATGVHGGEAGGGVRFHEVVGWLLVLALLSQRRSRSL